MNHSLRYIFVLALIMNMIWAVASPAAVHEHDDTRHKITLIDYDPLVNITINIVILSIRALDEIDDDSRPDFFLTVEIGDQEIISPTWINRSYIYNPWNITIDVADDKDIIAINISLFDQNADGVQVCDLSPDTSQTTPSNKVCIEYDVKTGWWTGDDHWTDASGYGRLSGCDDGSIYKNERDCEVLFNILQNDYDQDTVPFWYETHKYGTNPFFDNSNDDFDGDGIPLAWEHHWGFDPLAAENHFDLDHDNDSVTNYEEFLTASKGSDPFRKDLFLEIDFMNRTFYGKTSSVSQEAQELLKNPFHRRNIVFHMETGELIPYDEFTNQEELLDIYQKYFKQYNDDNWKRSVYHYGLFVHNCVPTGFSFAGDGPVFWGYLPGTNAFVVSASMMERYQKVNVKDTLDWFHASVIMHEMGHNFGIRYGYPMGCDNQNTKYPWQIGWYIYRNYESIMNYRYTYEILDYSDGSHGVRDFDDWSYINLSYFEFPNHS